jgi:sphinganine-1-phosphate aldolase
MAKAISSNTVAIVGSAPNFPHGVMDDIEALSKIAVKYKVPLHVDACLGGFLIAFFQSANIPFPKFDFNLPGVTSISADLHKYGLCPKGISLLLYKNREYRKHQYYFYPHFMGGLYPTPSFEGSRSPAFSAAAYAVLLYIGKNAYINQAKRVHEAVVKIRRFAKENFTEMYIPGNPQICGVAFIGPKALYVHDQMSARHWHLNMINSPMGFSFVVTSANVDNVDIFLQDLKECYDYVIANKIAKESESTKMYGMSLSVPEALVRENLDIICDMLLD